MFAQLSSRNYVMRSVFPSLSPCLDEDLFAEEIVNFILKKPSARTSFELFLFFSPFSCLLEAILIKMFTLAKW